MARITIDLLEVTTAGAPRTVTFTLRKSPVVTAEHQLVLGGTTQVTTDADGKAEIDLAPGFYQVVIEGVSTPVDRAFITVPLDDNTYPLAMLQDQCCGSSCSTPPVFQGPPGSQILSGPDDPDFSVGRFGDWYFNTSTHYVFGPKMLSGWGAGFDLNGAPVELQKNATHLQWKYNYELFWRDLIALSELAGPRGADGREVELQVTTSFLQWRYEGEPTWTNLLALSQLQGARGDDGDYAVMRNNGAMIQWKLSQEFYWKDLVAVSELSGPPGPKGDDGTDGREVEIRNNGEQIEWRYVGEAGWSTLVEVADLIGPTGPPGAGVPAGGSAGQVLVKDGVDDYETKWETLDQPFLPLAGGAMDEGASVVFTEALPSERHVLIDGAGMRAQDGGTSSVRYGAQYIERYSSGGTLAGRYYLPTSGSLAAGLALHVVPPGFTGLAKFSSILPGVLLTSVPGTDYLAPNGSGAALTNLNATNITTGTLAAARGGAGTVNGILKANGSGVVSQAEGGVDYFDPDHDAYLKGHQFVTQDQSTFKMVSISTDRLQVFHIGVGGIGNYNYPQTTSGTTTYNFLAGPFPHVPGGIVKYAALSGQTVPAVAGTDYLAPGGNGSGLTGLTKSQVGLGNVDNTSDLNKPISNATQTALNSKLTVTSGGASLDYLEMGISDAYKTVYTKDSIELETLAGGLTTLLYPAVASGTNWFTVAPTSLGAGILKKGAAGASSGVLSLATAGTDYLAPNGSGAALTNLNATNITTGTLAAARGGAGTVNGILKANGSGVVSQATAGTDYLTPGGSGAGLTSLNASQLTAGTVPEPRIPTSIARAPSAGQLVTTAIPTTGDAYYWATISTNTAYTFPSIPPTGAATVVFILTTSSGAVPSWPGSVNWGTLGAPTHPLNGVGVYTFIRANGQIHGRMS